MRVEGEGSSMLGGIAGCGGLPCEAPVGEATAGVVLWVSASTSDPVRSGAALCCMSGASLCCVDTTESSAKPGWPRSHADTPPARPARTTTTTSKHFFALFTGLTTKNNPFPQAVVQALSGGTQRIRTGSNPVARTNDYEWLGVSQFSISTLVDQILTKMWPQSRFERLYEAQLSTDTKVRAYTSVL